MLLTIRLLSLPVPFLAMMHITKLWFVELVIVLNMHYFYCYTIASLTFSSSGWWDTRQARDCANLVVPVLPVFRHRKGCARGASSYRWQEYMVTARTRDTIIE
jgi:hypothetical protein